MKFGISNLGITSCNVLSSKEDIETNSGFYSLLIILVIFIIIFIIFCTKGYNLLENKIDEVIYKKFDKKENNKKKKIKRPRLIEGGLQKRKTKKSKSKKQNKKK